MLVAFDSAGWTGYAGLHGPLLPDAGLYRKFSDDVLGVLQSDFGTQQMRRCRSDREVYGLNGYLYWNMTCRCQWGVNGEWFRDPGGFRVGQVLPSFGSPNPAAWPAPRFPDGSFYRFTFGPRYYFTPNFYTASPSWLTGMTARFRQRPAL